MNIKDIIGKNIVVNCKTEEEAKEFIRLAKENGCCWSVDDKDYGTNYGVYETATCYRIDFDRKIYFCSYKWYNSSNYKVIDFNEIAINFTETYQLDIKRKNYQTIAILKDTNGKYIKHAKAVCSSEDEYDYEVGKKIAFSRLFDIENVDTNKSVDNNTGEEPKSKSFKPYLTYIFDTSISLGILGELTPLITCDNERLYVGDIVEKFNSQCRSFGLGVVCKNNDNYYFVMGLAGENFKNNISQSGWQIVKRGSYKDLKPDTIIDCVKAIFSKQPA